MARLADILDFYFEYIFETLFVAVMFLAFFGVGMVILSSV